MKTRTPNRAKSRLRRTKSATLPFGQVRGPHYLMGMITLFPQNSETESNVTRDILRQVAALCSKSPQSICSAILDLYMEKHRP